MVFIINLLFIYYLKNFVNLYKNVIVVCLTQFDILTSNQPGLLVLKIKYVLLY